MENQQVTTETITLVAAEMAKAVVQAMKEKVGITDNTRTLSTANVSLSASIPTLKQPTFNLSSTDEYHALVNFEMGVKNRFMTKNYHIENSKRAPIVIKWVGNKGLHFV